MFAFLQRSPSPLARIRERFVSRTLILHRGFPDDWLAELLKQPGGGGHFRLDLRRLPQKRPTPLEWLAQQHILPLNLPAPLLARIDPDVVLLRHLTRGDKAVHPSEIAWFLEELDDRHHARLEWDAHSVRSASDQCIAISDNEPKAMFDSLG